MLNLTPKEIVAELDKYIVGQTAAKRCVAVALRNRYRRQRLREDMQSEILPKNIIMIGPTGVGKTEIARRLAKLVNAPFLKVEATKFTEVGYVGRDVESMVRDLVEVSIHMVENEKMETVKTQAEIRAEERVLDLLAPLPRRGRLPGEEGKYEEVVRRRSQLRTQLMTGELEGEMVEIEVEDKPQMAAGNAGMEEMGINIQELIGGFMPKKTKRQRVSVAEARKILTQEEAEKLIDTEEVNSVAIRRAEQMGIIFLDEIDKIAGEGANANGPDVSRGGVQRDILPIVEGTMVNTKYGPVKTDYMLFIAAGAFHVSKPSDLIPELQGRFPIRVELDSLSREDFKRILLEPENSLIKQYMALLEADGVALEFAEDGIDAMAEIADTVNAETENIGARRLHTILEKVLEDLLFDAPNDAPSHVLVDGDMVRGKLAHVAVNNDLSRYIL